MPTTGTKRPDSTALAPVSPANVASAAADLGWPYVAIGKPDDHPLARWVIGSFGLVLGASAGLFVGGMAAALLAALIHPFLPHLAELVLLSVTVFSLSIGAVVGRRVLERETFE